MWFCIVLWSVLGETERNLCAVTIVDKIKYTYMFVTAAGAAVLQLLNVSLIDNLKRNSIITFGSKLCSTSPTPISLILYSPFAPVYPLPSLSHRIAFHFRQPENQHKIRSMHRALQQCFAFDWLRLFLASRCGACNQQKTFPCAMADIWVPFQLKEFWGMWCISSSGCSPQKIHRQPMTILNLECATIHHLWITRTIVWIGFTWIIWTPDACSRCRKNCLALDLWMTWFTWTFFFHWIYFICPVSQAGRRKCCRRLWCESCKSGWCICTV